MPTYRVTLEATVRTTPIIIKAPNRENLDKLIDELDLPKLIGTCADTLNIAIVGSPVRVMDGYEESFPKGETAVEPKLIESNPTPERPAHG